MWSNGELLKKQKLAILIIAAVIFAFIFLVASQAISKGPTWHPNYEANVQGELKGTGLVKLQGKGVSSGPGDNFLLNFITIEGFMGERYVWLNFGFPKGSDRSNFYCSWTSDYDGADYSLSGWGFVEYNNRTKVFTFISDAYDGDYHITRWAPPEEPIRVWQGLLEFTIQGIPLPD